MIANVHILHDRWEQSWSYSVLHGTTRKQLIMVYVAGICSCWWVQSVQIYLMSIFTRGDHGSTNEIQSPVYLCE